MSSENNNRPGIGHKIFYIKIDANCFKANLDEWNGEKENFDYNKRTYNLINIKNNFLIKFLIRIFKVFRKGI